MAASAAIEARFAAAHARLRTIATTGTNGKTTTTSMIASVVAVAEPSARLTTLGGWVGEQHITAESAGSAVQEFLATVEGAVAGGVKTLALEVTSLALSDGFARRWPPSVAVFTNLTRDHFDTHGTAEAYLAAKAQLFMALTAGQTAVLNQDDPASELLREVIAPGVSVESYSIGASATLSAREIAITPEGTRIRFHDSPFAHALGGELMLSVYGTVHGQNAMAAALACRAAGYAPEVIRRGLLNFVGVAGRFEVISRNPWVIVDYAHTPDALVGTLRTARSLCTHRLLCLFGCGGERDRGKRPQMGSVVNELADLAVLTTDNPRREDPSQIAQDILSGVIAGDRTATWVQEPDRTRAIAWAIHQAQPGDVVVIAGKGHERVQEIGTETLAFSDAEIARSVVAGLRTNA